jgi:Sec-independent protein translocase protein TatA
MFFGPEKILVVLVLALILLGPDKLPAMARQLGAAWKALRDFQTKVETEVRNTVPDLPSTADIARYARSPVSLLNTLAELGSEDPVPDPGAPDAAPHAAAEADAAGDWPADPGSPDAAAASGPAVNGAAANGSSTNGPAVNGSDPITGPVVDGAVVDGAATNGAAGDGPAVNGRRPTGEPRRPGAAAVAFPDDPSMN